MGADIREGAMSITEDIKAALPIEQFLMGYVALKKSGHNYKGLCPFHQEKSPSFVVRPGKQSWKCYGCGRGGSIFTFVMLHDNLDFAGALEVLAAQARIDLKSNSQAIADKQKSRAQVEPPKPKLVAAEPPSESYQALAWQIIERAEEILWSPDDEYAAEVEIAMSYLREKRGLLAGTIKHFRLGYIPGPWHKWETYHGLKIPHGICIPWITEGIPWGIRVRRFVDDENKRRAAQNQHLPKNQQKKKAQKYMSVYGEDEQRWPYTLHFALYGIDDLLSGLPILFCEGDFDNMILWQEAQDYICGLTAGAASYAINPRWYPYLASAPRIFECYDGDKAGNDASERFGKLTSRAKRIAVPTGKDINEFHLQGGMRAVTRWIKSLVEPETTQEAA
jgi:hypothetical protein